MNPISCLTCTDPDCPKRGTDSAACEDWTNLPPVLETVPEGVPDGNCQGCLDTCPLHAVLEARLGRMEDLVARMKREVEQ